jgi:hypothetical protein
VELIKNIAAYFVGLGSGLFICGRFADIKRMSLVGLYFLIIFAVLYAVMSYIITMDKINNN